MTKKRSIQELAELLAEHRKKEQSIVLCHGVFDLLHIGHIKYLEAAKEMGDILVVTLTEDRYVQKGPGRPAFNQGLRAEAIAALECVDYVAINEWPTAIETLGLLKPTFYVKGPDYQENSQDRSGNIGKEKDAVEAVGGTIRYTQTPLYSSSALINRHFSTLTTEQQATVDHLKETYSFSEIEAYIKQLESLDVIALGEIILDEYIFCNTLGKSGKEPLLMSQELSREMYAGGILAVANHLAAFVKSVTVVSAIGDHADHKAFIESHLSSNVRLRTVAKSNSPTIVKKRFIEDYSKAKLFGTYVFNDALVNADEEAQLMAHLVDAQYEKNPMVIVDYGHGLITPSMAKVIPKKSPFLVVNTQINAANTGYHSISKYSNCSIVCIHEGELRQDYRDRTEDVKTLMTKLHEDRAYGTVIITRGVKGSVAYSGEAQWTQCPAFTTVVKDRVGAGDTFLALVSLCLRGGMPMDLALFIANLAGAFAVAHVGTGCVISREYLLTTMEKMLK